MMLAGLEIVAVQLEELSPAFAHGEYKPVLAHGRKPPASHGLEEERELLPRAAGHGHAMNLRRICETGADQHLTFRRMPALEARTAEALIDSELPDQLSRNFRNALGLNGCWDLLSGSDGHKTHPGNSHYECSR